MRAKAVEDSDSDSDDGAKLTGRGVAKSNRRAVETAAQARTERSFRSTTTMRSEISKVLATEAQSKKLEGAKTRQVVEDRRLTQDELLAEAAVTAIENDKDLQVFNSFFLCPLVASSSTFQCSSKCR